MAFLRKVLIVATVFVTMSGSATAGSHTKPEKRLWDHAQRAMADGKFAVANVTLHTLVNTYPHSKYAARAKKQLLDPRIVTTCSEWSNPPVCDPQQQSLRR